MAHHPHDHHEDSPVVHHVHTVNINDARTDVLQEILQRLGIIEKSIHGYVTPADQRLLDAVEARIALLVAKLQKLDSETTH